MHTVIAHDYFCCGDTLKSPAATRHEFYVWSGSHKVGNRPTLVLIEYILRKGYNNGYNSESGELDG